MRGLSAHLRSTKFPSDQVDIITDASLLCKLLQFSKGSSMRTFRFILQMIEDSLVLARDPAHDPTLPPSASSESETLQFAVKDFCTEMPPGLEHSHHYRGVQYSLGHLNCVVQSRVDALCSTSPGKLQPSSSPSAAGSVVGKGDHPQSEAAIIQVRCSWRRYRGIPSERVWFSRTPFVLRGRLDREGIIKRVKKIDAFAESRKWEEKEIYQVALRKLATLLSDLKRSVKVAAPNGQACFGLIENSRDLEPLRLQVFLGEDKSQEDISNIPWVGKTSHGPDEASNGGGGDSASEAKAPQDKTLSNTHNQLVQ